MYPILNIVCKSIPKVEGETLTPTNLQQNVCVILIQGYFIIHIKTDMSAHALALDFNFSHLLGAYHFHMLMEKFCF